LILAFFLLMLGTFVAAVYMTGAAIHTAIKARELRLATAFYISFGILAAIITGAIVAAGIYVEQCGFVDNTC
jgi:hypothetical protein